MKNYALEYLNERIKEVEDVLNGLDENRFVATPERLKKIADNYNRKHIDLMRAIKILDTKANAGEEQCNSPVVNPRLLFDKGMKYAYELANDSHVDDNGELTVSLDVITDVAKTYVKHVKHFLNEV
jgi:hypothetical protein